MWSFRLLVVVALVAGSCAEGSASTSEEVPAAPIVAPSTSAVPTTSAASAPSSAAPPAAVASPTTTTTTTTTTTIPVFASTVSEVTAAQLGASWREGCPVGPDELRALTLSHWTPDGTVTEGTLVVHRDHADDLIDVFASLFDAGFPITAMRPVVDFDGDDSRSMAADNTSAFNCREVSGRSGVWSEHSFGAAIDINPLRNPYVRGALVDPPQGAAFLDRTLDDPGLIREGDVVTSAFAAIGWTWGGSWSSATDYQHFSASGR